MYLFWIGGTIFDSNVITQAYNMNQVEEYGSTEYVDGWWKKHRTIARTRISGTVRLGFTASEFDDFLSLMESARDAEGGYTVHAFVVNLNDFKEFNAYINTTAKAAIPLKDFNTASVTDAAYYNVDLTVEER